MCEPSPISEFVRCAHCSDVIGVYEPLVRVLNGRTYETSRALQPVSCDQGAEHYHRACYERLGEDRPLIG